jgi:hypothetical protein
MGSNKLETNLISALPARRHDSVSFVRALARPIIFSVAINCYPREEEIGVLCTATLIIGIQPRRAASATATVSSPHAV